MAKMDIKKRDFLTAGLSIGAGLAASGALAQDAPPARGGGGGRDASAPVNSNVQPSSVDMNYKPRRINKAIELWEDGQPVYYTNAGMVPGIDPYEHGKRMAKTYADCLNYGLEQGPLDFTALALFLRGLKDGGPTKSGHATPAVFVEPPVTGLNEAYAMANSWVVKNLLDIGVHGVHICHARDPKAIEVYAQMAARFEIDYPDTPKLRRIGLRGQPPGGAPAIWGISSNKYMHVADVWPLNPKGEVMIGVKIEDRYADANMVKVLATKGIAFAEWGPTDNTQSLFGLAAYPENESGRAQRTPEQLKKLADVRAKVLAECRKNNIRFLNSSSDQPGDSYVTDQIKDGAMLMGGPEKAAIMGREFTKRKMPV
jgi:4-hydroxy-2-oxoheptanedioate aldolase